MNQPFEIKEVRYHILTFSLERHIELYLFINKYFLLLFIPPEGRLFRPSIRLASKNVRAFLPKFLVYFLVLQNK